MQKFTKLGGAGYILIAAMLWGTTGTAQALAPPGATSLAIGAIRVIFGSISLLLFAFLRGSLKKIENWPLKTTIVAAISLALFSPLFFAGIAMTGVAVGTVIGIGSSPVFAGLLGYILYKEKPGKPWYIATLLAVLGNVLLVASGKSLSINPLGIMLALGAGLAYAMYTLTSKELLKDNSPELVLAVVFSCSAVLLSPILLVVDLSWLAETRGMMVAIHLGVVTIAIAYWFFSQGLTKISAANAVSLTLAEPLTAALLGVVLLGERLTLPVTVGLLLILMGLIIISYKPK